MITFALILSLATPAFAKTTPCEPALARPVAYAVRDATEGELVRRGFGRRALGYAALVSAMVLAPAATAYVTSQFPDWLRHFTDPLVSLSVLGVIALASPIKDRYFSASRKLAFLVDGAPELPDRRALEEQWTRTNNVLSLNQQMSRNVITSYVTSVRQNFTEARLALVAGDPALAADQVAEAAVRLRELFPDLSPDERSVALVVRATFTGHVVVDDAFRALVEARVSAFDPESSVPAVRRHYARALGAWLDENGVEDVAQASTL